jgi:F0F1-type ATP synthase membrane subunit a
LIVIDAQAILVVSLQGFIFVVLAEVTVPGKSKLIQLSRSVDW